MKVALVHDFLNQYGGAERVLEAIHELYPYAPVYTSLYEPLKLPLRMRNWDVRPFHLPRIPFGCHLSKAYTFFYPLLFENIDLSEYDLVISSTANFAKGVITRPGTPHISYIHTPPRFLYHYPTEVNRRKLWYLKPILAPLDSLLRVWDFSAAQRPDFLVTNSKETAKRVRKFYGREATVIYPPVSLSKPAGENLSGLEPSTRKVGESTGGYFLIVSRLAAYKRIDLAIEACSRLGLPLKIVGTGREEKRLKRLATSKPRGRRVVELLGFVGDGETSELYRNCRAFIFPGAEDFGITPIEAMSFGKPVIAFGEGGALETVIEGKTGTFFEQETAESLIDVLRSFDPSKYKAKDCVAQAKKFSKKRFQREFKQFIAEKMEKRAN
jgi:glycosyltransferase involved in cell wall biosynthesis